MNLHFRVATPADTEAAIPLIYSSGPAAFDYVFKHPARGTALDFLRHAFADGAGEFGYRNHTIVETGGQIVGIGACFSGREAFGFTP
ncbi:MAG: GNAT family N-acetyltransferase, partial [Anaerolineales bacterium]|nr:GNAT family N-acetyltransferase [Anaerolineales bacterium]